MFKFAKGSKGGNLVEKLNKMSKKQIYTWVAILMVCFIALVTMGSLMGNSASDSSFDGMSSRGYDLAQMPFLNDEAEEYLLASKYPDMRNNNVTTLYSGEQKKDRQEEDAEKAAEEAASSGEGLDTSASSSGRETYSGRIGGGSGGGGSRTPTEVGQLNTSSSGGKASGSGLNATWGAPRGDFSPYKTQEKGTEGPVQPLQNSDARRALSQFAQTSRAAAGLKDGKGGNAKRALMGGNIQGSQAFTESGVDLSKASGLGLDTNAPTSSTDLSSLDEDMADSNEKAKKEFLDEGKSFWAMLGEKLLDVGINLVQQWAGGAINNMMANKQAKNGTSAAWYGTNPDARNLTNGLKGAGEGAWPITDIQGRSGAVGSVSDYFQQNQATLGKIGITNPSQLTSPKDVIKKFNTQSKSGWQKEVPSMQFGNGGRNIPDNPCGKGGVYDATKNTWNC